MPGNRSLFSGPFSFDPDTNTASIDLPTGGRVAVSPRGAEVSLAGGGRVSFGPGGGAVEVPGAGRLEVSGTGMVLLPDGQLWNTRDLFFPDVGSTPTPGGPVPIPYPNIGTSPIEIRIPIPHFVVERLEVPITLPTFSAHPLDVPVPMPRVQPTPFDLPWPYLMPPGFRLPALPAAMPFPDMPELVTSLGPPARYVTQIKTAIAGVVDQATLSTEVVVGVINGSVGMIPPGALRSSVNFKSALRSALLAAGVPSTPYFSITDILADAWTDWFAGFSTIVQYPSFAQWPGPEAPPMPAIGQTLSVGQSSGASKISAIALHAAVFNTVDPSAADSDFENAMRQLTLWYSSRFAAFAMSTLLTNVMGGGPVPSYAPPDVPAGPVIGGAITRSTGVLIGSNPFRVP